MLVRRLRWKNKIRTLSLVAMLLLAMILVGRLPLSAVRAQATLEYTTVTVRPGDTIWTLAVAHRPDGEDVRRFVDSIIAINGLDGSLIRPGQQIRVPVATGP